MVAQSFEGLRSIWPGLVMRFLQASGRYLVKWGEIVGGGGGGEDGDGGYEAGATKWRLVVLNWRLAVFGRVLPPTTPSSKANTEG